MAILKKGNQKEFSEEYRKPWKGVLYKDKGTSILKELTTQGKIVESIFLHIERNRQDRFLSDRKQGSIAREYYWEIVNRFDYQIQDWALSLAQVNSETDRDRNIEREQYYRNLDRSIEFDEHLDSQRRESVRCKYSCKKIQHRWRITRFILKRNSRIIQKAWREFLVISVEAGVYDQYPPSENLSTVEDYDTDAKLEKQRLNSTL